MHPFQASLVNRFRAEQRRAPPVQELSLPLIQCHLPNHTQPRSESSPRRTRCQQTNLACTPTPTHPENP
ncbi:hypothetical protein B0H17DRAFT_1091807 [Mycena rosella]|uniref:Uncharacterized protein n=1 Tax=Mycena rosella TaxID=1033263 RepID=A0AAD7CUE3_MYCRO|nr:hypothetical protein B0H17DRAFT_1091807 [Mycena rosella]